MAKIVLDERLRALLNFYLDTGETSFRMDWGDGEETLWFFENADDVEAFYKEHLATVRIERIIGND